MLVLDPELITSLNAHAEEAYPRECCGLLLGTRDGNTRQVVGLQRARNTSPVTVFDRYQLHPADRLAAEERARGAGLELVGFYHSHPEHDAYFSATDLQSSEEFQFGEPWLPATYAYLVSSVRQGRAGTMRCYLVVQGQAVECPIEIR